MEHYVEFPALGWHIPLSDTLVEFELFGATFSIKWYGLLIALGFVLAYIYGTVRAKKFGIDPDRMFDVVIVYTIVGFIGARLYYVVFSGNLDQYLANPISILQVWKGGLGIYGGIIFAFLSALLMCRWRKVNTRAMFDLASLGFLIGQGVGRWGNFFNQEAFGGNTTLPWGMTGDVIQAGTTATMPYDHTLPVHPTFLYESLWCLLGFVILHIVSKKAYKFKGQIFSMYLIWYGVGRFGIESLRTDSLFFGTMRISQLVAILSVLLGIILLFVFRAYQNRLPKEMFAEEGDAGEDMAEEEAADVPADGETALEEAPAAAEGDFLTTLYTPETDEEEAALQSPEDAPAAEAVANETDKTEETEDGDTH